MRLLTLVLAATALERALAMAVGETQSNGQRDSASSSDGNNGLRLPDWVVPSVGTGFLGAWGMRRYMKGQERRRIATAAPPEPPVKPFRHDEYESFWQLREEVRKRTEQADPFGFDWIHECAWYRERVNWRDAFDPDRTVSIDEESLRSCSQEYFDWVAINGPANEQRLPTPTYESETARAQKLKAEKERRVVGEEGSTGPGNTDTMSLKFAGVKLPGLKTSVNLGALQRSSTQMLAQTPQIAKSAVQDAPKFAALAMQNAPKTPHLRALPV